MVYSKSKEFNRPEVGRSSQRLFRDFSKFPRKVVAGIAVVGFVFLYSLHHSKNAPLNLLSKIEMLNESVRARIKSAFSFLEHVGETKKNLRLQVAELEEQLRFYERAWLNAEQLREENEALRGVLPLVRGHKTLTVAVKPKPGHPFLFVTYPSADALEQIEIGALAVAPQGFVGTVVAKEETKVLLLLATQVQSRIPVRSRQSHRQALLVGRNSPFFTIKYTHREVEDNDEGISIKDTQRRPIFIKEADLKQDFIDGEILELCDTRIPVARIVRKNGKTLAEWVVQTPSNYITILLK